MRVAGDVVLTAIAWLTGAVALLGGLGNARVAAADGSTTASLRPVPDPGMWMELDEMQGEPGDRWANPLRWIADHDGAAPIPGLVSCLDDPNPRIRATALWVLACLGTTGEGVAWEDLFVPGKVSEHPVPVGTILGPILAQADSPEPLVRREVVRQLHGMLSNGRLTVQHLRAIADRWLPMLTDTDETARHYAALLAQAVPELRGRVPSASSTWVDADQEVRRWPPRAWHLLSLSTATLVHLASSGTVEERRRVFEALKSPIAQNGRQVDPAILAAVQAGVQDPDPTVRRKAIEALTDAHDARYLPLLRQRLADSARIVRSQALISLLQLHDDTVRAALPRLAASLIEEDSAAFLELLLAECPHGHPRGPEDLIALPFIVDHFDDPSWRFSRAWALRHLSPLLGDAFRSLLIPGGPDTIEAMVGGPRAFRRPPDDCSDDFSVRPACLVPVLGMAIGRLPGPRTKAAALLRAAALRDGEGMERVRVGDPDVQLAGALALASIGDRRGLPDLVVALPRITDPLWHRALVRALAMTSRTNWLEHVPGHPNGWQEVQHPWPSVTAYQQLRALLLHGSPEDVRTAFGAFWFPLGTTHSIPVEDRAQLLPAIQAERLRERLPGSP